MYRRLALLTIPFFSTPLILALSYNVTIDDQMGDPTTGRSVVYYPTGAWSDGQTCRPCTAQPSLEIVHMGTWKDSTFEPPEDPDEPPAIRTASVSFIGTAVYVNCILTGSRSHPNGNTDLTFTIDGEIMGTFKRVPDGDNSYLHVTVFSWTGLSNSVHTVTIESGHGGERVLILLDSIVYTKEIDQPTVSPLLPSITLNDNQAGMSTSGANVSTTSSSTNTATIAGSVVGGLVAITAILAISFFCYRRQKSPRGGVRFMLDTADVSSPVSPYTQYSSYPSSPSRVYQEDRRPPFVIGSVSVPTLSPGDSVSQTNDSDNTSDWTSASGKDRPGRTYRERAHAFAQSRGRTSVVTMKVQNVTDADLQEIEGGSEILPPAYTPSRRHRPFLEKEKSCVDSKAV